MPRPRSLALWRLLLSLSLCQALAASGIGRADDVDGARWHVLETDNFRIMTYGRRPLGADTAENCERMRTRLARQWLAEDAIRGWSPKCDVVLHASLAAYVREVGDAGRETVASAVVDRRDGAISLRRIDVLATRGDWQSAALPHELAHVVLADRFGDKALPRWLDEGMAVLADPLEKRDRHERDLRRAVARGDQFRVAELWALTGYPPPRRWGAFYGQSASIVAYLVEQQGHGRFVEFVDLALERGCEHALRRVYRLEISDLERLWHVQLGESADPPRLRSS